MSDGAVAGNYAETLLELAAREEAVEDYGDWLAEMAAYYRNEADVRRFLDTPRVTVDEKKEAIRSAFGDRAPENFVHFLLVVLDKGRHRLLPAMEERYRELVDEREGRVHATVTLSREPDEATKERVASRLSEIVGRRVVPHFRTDEEVVGGIVVRMSDQVMDGSLRRRLDDLKRELLAGETRS